MTTSVRQAIPSDARCAERELQQLGVVRLQLQLGAENERARAFYIAHGYAPRSRYELWDKRLTLG